MRRRGVGVAAIQRERKAAEAVAAVGEALAVGRVAELERQIGAFKANLEEFAMKYKKEINTVGRACGRLRARRRRRPPPC